MSRIGIITNNAFQLAKTAEIRNSKVIMLEKAEMLTKLYKQLTQNFLDIIILKKLRKRKMRLCELSKSLKREFYISIDTKKLHKTVKSMKDKKLLEICEINGRKFYCLTNEGERTVETIRRLEDQIHEIVLNAVPS
ncbi:hypothetical protein J7K06_04535 [Candidatus Bathyarchaeota archaeon]|nr:hypothetical protein [Candidatus Bathyarchaeota archaeon]